MKGHRGNKVQGGLTGVHWHNQQRRWGKSSESLTCSAQGQAESRRGDAENRAATKFPAPKIIAPPEAGAKEEAIHHVSTSVPGPSWRGGARCRRKVWRRAGGAHLDALGGAVAAVLGAAVRPSRSPLIWNQFLRVVSFFFYA